MLGKLRPDSWLPSEVRRKIEEVFLRNDDQAGLVAYYERWTKKEPEDIEALVRLGRTLATMGRAAEAQPWYEKAIKLAPSRRDLRLALIAQLARTRNSPRPPRSTSCSTRPTPITPTPCGTGAPWCCATPPGPLPERKAAAAAIWRKLLVAKPNDPVTTAQVADLLRQAEMVDDALALYRKAVEQAPGNPQYHEYLGEYLHNLKRPDEAMAAWAKIAEGPNRNAKNLGRLAEVLAGFGYVKEAIAPSSEAVALEKDDFDLRLKLADYLHRLGQLRRRRDPAGRRRASWPSGTRRKTPFSKLASRTTRRPAGWPSGSRPCGRSWTTTRNPTAERWAVLARYLEADGKLPEAVRAADRAIAVEPRSIPAWTLAARVRESAGNLGDAADALRRLAEIDRRNRAEYLIGHRQARVAAGPGRRRPQGRPRPPGRRAGQSRAVRVLRPALLPARPVGGRARRPPPGRAGQSHTTPRPSSPSPRPSPASTRPRKPSRCTGGPSTGPTTWTTSSTSSAALTELYLQRNQLDRLLTRLQHQDATSEPAGRRPGSQARRGDLPGAGLRDLGRPGRRPLRARAAAGRQHPRHPAAPAALEAGRGGGRHRERRPVPEAAQRAGPQRRGAVAAGAALCALGRPGGGPGGLVEDGRGQGREHFTSTRRWTACSSIRSRSRSWRPPRRCSARTRTTGRPSIARARPWRRCDKPEEAEQAFQALLALTIADDEKSAFAKARARNPRLQAPNALTRSSRYTQAIRRWKNGSAWRICIRHVLRTRRSTIPQGYSWSPADFGQARMAALGWLVEPGARSRDRRRSTRSSPPFRKPPRSAGRPPCIVGLVLPVCRCGWTTRACSRPPGR